MSNLKNNLLCVIGCFFLAGTGFAELSLSVIPYVLPRGAGIEDLFVNLVVDDVLPSDYEAGEGEEDVWERLTITLPDSDAPDKYLFGTEEIPAEVRDEVSSQFYYEVVSRAKDNSRNKNGNETVNYEFIIHSRGRDGFGDLFQKNPHQIRIVVSYHRWDAGEEQYGDAEVEIEHAFPRIDGVPNEAPAGVDVEARHHRLHISWATPEFVVYNNEQGEFAPSGVNIFIAEQPSASVSLTSAARVFRTRDAGGDTSLPPDTECNLMPDCSLACAERGSGEESAELESGKAFAELEGIYFDIDLVKQIPEFAKSQMFTGDEAIITGLTPGTAYFIIAQYYPDGLQRSVCQTAVPIENFTLLELNGEKLAERSEDNCFVITATFGDGMVANYFRKFRDKYLITNVWGSEFIALYYQHAPAYAELISGNLLLRLLCFVVLLIPLLFIVVLMHPFVALLSLAVVLTFT